MHETWMKRGLWLLTLALACSSPKTQEAVLDTVAGDVAVDIADTVTATDAGEDAAPDSGSTDASAPDVTPDVGPPVDVTYLTIVDDAADPTGASATVGENAQLSADLDLVYPPDNAMAPRDFAPIAIQWKYNGPLPAFFGVRLENGEAEIDVLGDPVKWDAGVGYTVTLPDAAWQALFQFPDAQEWKIRVIAADMVNGQLVTPLRSSKPVTLHVTNQKVGGAIYYWNTTLATVRVLENGSLTPKTLPGIGGGMMGCAGCHSVSPDGSTVAFSKFFGGGMGFSSMGMSLINAKSGVQPAWLNQKAADFLASSFTIAAAFSPSYFSNSEKWLVVPQGGKLRSVNLLTGDNYGLVKGGDLGQQAFPAWSPNGETLVYASAKDVGNGFSGSVATALYTVPFGDGADTGKGGQATAIAGADEPGIFHYYPSISPDGSFVVYNRADPAGPTCPSSGGGGGPSSGGGATTYDNCNAEVWMVPIGGGTAIRLDNANQSTDPLTNSWPTFGQITGQYYWLAFSSRRDYGFLHTGNPPTPQVYIAAVDPQKLMDGKDGSFAALWLPGQDINSGCHIARWSAPPRDQ